MVNPPSKDRNIPVSVVWSKGIEGSIAPPSGKNQQYTISFISATGVKINDVACKILGGDAINPPVLGLLERVWTFITDKFSCIEIVTLIQTTKGLKPLRILINKQSLKQQIQASEKLELGAELTPQMQALQKIQALQKLEFGAELTQHLKGSEMQRAVKMAAPSKTALWSKEEDASEVQYRLMAQTANKIIGIAAPLLTNPPPSLANPHAAVLEPTREDTIRAEQRQPLAPPLAANGNTLVHTAEKVTSLFARSVWNSSLGLIVASNEELAKGGENVVYSAERLVPDQQVEKYVVRRPIGQPLNNPEQEEKRLKQEEKRQQQEEELHDKLQSVPGLVVPSSLHYTNEDGKKKAVGVAPYYNRGTFRQVSEHVTTLPAKVSVFRQCLEQVAGMHEQGVLHLDIKPENVLLKEQKKGQFIVGVTDFGLSKELKEGQGPMIHPMDGTIPYLAPERFKALNITLDKNRIPFDESFPSTTPTNVKASQTDDSWGLGLTLYPLVFGEGLPWLAAASEVRENLIDRAQSWEPWQHVAFAMHSQLQDPNKYIAWHTHQSKQLLTSLPNNSTEDQKQELQLKLLTMELLNPDPQKRLDVKVALQKFQKSFPPAPGDATTTN